MKISQITKRNTASSEMPIMEKNQSSTMVEDKPSETCGIRQSKDGVTFTAFYPGANTVQIAGDFNNWQPAQTPMKKSGRNGIWKVKLPLNAGTHRYRYVVDGHWQQDPYNDAAEPNSYGEFNSVIQIH